MGSPLRLFAPVALSGLVLAAAGCGVISGERPAKDKSAAPPAAPAGNAGGGGNGKAIASAPMAVQKGKVRAELIALDRGPANSVLVRLRLVNEEAEAFSPTYTLDWPAADGVHPAEPTRPKATGITLVDPVANKRYFPLTGADGGCLCSDTLNTTIEPGGSAEFYAVLPAPPANVSRIAVSVPLTQVFPDVPIGAGPARPPAGADPAGARPPTILPLVSTVEGGDQAVDEGDANQSIRLSSDVLFALNKADITAKAESILTDVAKRIDRSADATVQIDGHTDDTGNDAINDPLSLRRAQAVQRVLGRLITRSGVGYQSAGHGSKEPVAANSSDAGRQRNRRVTVTFARPAPAPAGPGPAPAAPGRPVGAARPTAAEVRSLNLDVTELRRSPTGLVNLVWKLTNNGGEQFDSTTQFTTPVTNVFYFGGYSGGTMGVTLYDEATGRRYYTLRDTQNRCLCVGLGGGGDYRIMPGGAMTHANSYKLPPEVKSVTVEFPGYEPLRGAAVG
jgi:outer membrane protein OmpA-like peptidoglycan-associated protein